MKARVPRGKSGRTALCGMLAAVSLALLWVAGMAPSGRLGLSALAGLGPVVAVLTAGRGAGYLCWAASGVLGLLLTPDKGAAAPVPGLFRAVSRGKGPAGVYGPPRGGVGPEAGLLQWGAHPILVFVSSAAVPTLPAWLGGGLPVLYGLGNLVFVLYDVGLSRLIALLLRRLP